MHLTDKQIKRIITAAGAVVQEARHHRIPIGLRGKLNELEAATTVKPEGLSYERKYGVVAKEKL